MTSSVKKFVLIPKTSWEKLLLQEDSTKTTTTTNPYYLPTDPIFIPSKNKTLTKSSSSSSSSSGLSPTTTTTTRPKIRETTITKQNTETKKAPSEIKKEETGSVAVKRKGEEIDSKDSPIPSKKSQKEDTAGDTTRSLKNNLKQNYLKQVRKDPYKKKLVSALFGSSKIKFSNNHSIIVNNVETNIGILSFVNTVRSKKQNTNFTELHQLILDNIDTEPSWILNPSATQNQDDWIPYNI